MRELTIKELDLFEQLISVPQRTLKKALTTFLKSKYSKVVNTKDYICCQLANNPIISD